MVSMCMYVYMNIYIHIYTADDGIYVFVCIYEYMCQLYVHIYSADDGVFWMNISDFLRLFSRITYVNMLPGLYMQVARGKI